MRRLPGILIATGATLIVLAALAVSAMRLLLPQLDSFRPQWTAWAQSVAGVPLSADEVRGSWETFGPTLEIRNLRIQHPDADWQAERITVALDVWQSLLHWRWQFRDLTFYRLQLAIKKPLSGRQGNSDWQPDELGDLFLRQFDHFDLRDSLVTFTTPAGTQAELRIPQLTWLNGPNRHRAEGQIGLSSFNGQHGMVQIRMDLRDEQGWLNNGVVYLQADNIDMKPWLSRWLRSNTGLESADFSLAAWLTVRNGAFYAGDLLLNQGNASWRDGDTPHRLRIDDMTLHASRQENGWRVDVPVLKAATDGVAWPQGRIAALWLPRNEQLLGPDRPAELRVRAADLALERLGPLLPLLGGVTPELKARWQDLQPAGTLSALALDVPWQQPENTRFQARWQDVSWRNWQQLPGMNHFSGTAAGSLAAGRADIRLQQSEVPMPALFRAPLAVAQATASLNWRHQPQGWELWSQGLDVQAKSLWVNGDFRYRQPAQGEPRLDMLAGLRLTDAADAWRYYPERYMGKETVQYLNRAIQGGQVDNGTLIFAGNPRRFPFEHHDGQFQALVPITHAAFAFQPGWPALTDLNIELNFQNNGLWMSAPHILLGQVSGNNVTAVIPDYDKEQLLIDGELRGDGKEVSDYFNQTPMKSTLGLALRQVQLGGEVNSTLHLNIPLSHGDVKASGDVTLNNNSLYIKPIDSTLKALTGRFHYANGDLDSGKLQANWLGQPLTLDFTTREQEKAMQIDVGLQGDWLPSRLPGLPAALTGQLTGGANWRGKVAVALPYRGAASYDIGVQADLKEVSSHLPAPLDKRSGVALPLQVTAKGDERGFTLSGQAGKGQRFNSQWLLSRNSATLVRAAWQPGESVPPLPDGSALALSLPPLDGERWLAMLPALRGSLHSAVSDSRFHLPEQLTLTTPALKVLGQQWNDLTVTRRTAASGAEITAKGKEIDGRLTIPASGVWRGDLNYLYYNPQWQGEDATNPAALAQKTSPLNDPSIRFEDWPALQFNCRQCWVMGQNLGRMQGALTPQPNKLLLTDGLIDSGKAKLTVSGSWQEGGAEGTRTALKGKLSGDSLTQNAEWLGIPSPFRAADFNLDYDLYWRGTPWEPDIASLSGILKTHIGKGEIAEIGTGQAGQLLRLLSFDSLLRKLRFDFSDTFGKGFYFDSVNSTSWIKDGVLHTDNLLIDGLEADIAMRGDLDLVKRQVDMEAVVAPEISATVGVATAFAVNPVVGAAVFAASKVLAPLWSKISLIRYHLSGSLDQPKIQEVVRAPQPAKTAPAVSQ